MSRGHGEASCLNGKLATGGWGETRGAEKEGREPGARDRRQQPGRESAPLQLQLTSGQARAQKPESGSAGLW